MASSVNYLKLAKHRANKTPKLYLTANSYEVKGCENLYHILICTRALSARSEVQTRKEAASADSHASKMHTSELLCVCLFIFTQYVLRRLNANHTQGGMALTLYSSAHQPLAGHIQNN